MSLASLFLRNLLFFLIYTVSFTLMYLKQNQEIYYLYIPLTALIHIVALVIFGIKRKLSLTHLALNIVMIIVFVLIIMAGLFAYDFRGCC